MDIFSHKQSQETCNYNIENDCLGSERPAEVEKMCTVKSSSLLLTADKVSGATVCGCKQIIWTQKVYGGTDKGLQNNNFHNLLFWSAYRVLSLAYI